MNSVHQHSIGLCDHFTTVAGQGVGSTHLNAFDAALWDAGVGNYNLLRVSSILPPMAQRSDSIEVPYGAPLLIAYGCLDTAVPGEMVSASIAIGVPSDPALPGVIMEHSHRGGLQNALDIVERMAREAMDLRQYPVKEIIVFGAETKSNGQPAAAFAGCALWR